MEFNVDVNIVPHGQEKIDEIEQKIKSLQGKSVKIDFDTSGLSGLDKLISGNSSQYKKAGQNIGTQISQGINSGIGKASISSASEFSKTQQKMRKDIKDTADELGKIYPDLSENDAKKDAQGYYSAVAKEQERANKEIQKATEKARREAEQSASKQNSSLETYIDSEKGDAILSRMRKQMESYAGQSTPNIEKANGLMQEFSSSLVALKDHKSGTSILDDESLDNTIQKIQKAETSFKNVFSQIKDETSKTLGLGVAEQSANKVAAYYESNSKAVKRYGATLKELEQQYRQVTTVEEKATLDTAFKNLQSRISAEGLTGKSGIDEFKRAFKQIGQFAGIYGAIQNVIMEVPSKVINSVKDVDSAMTNLYKVTDESQSRYSKYLDTASNNAPKLGRSMSSYISQTSEWSKLGYSLDDSEQLSKLSSMYANVGEVSDNTAVSDMVTAMKAFNIQASDAESIIDQLNILGNNFATSSADLGEGLSNSASSLATAGNDLGHSLAMLTGMSEITQSAPEAGNALKILAMRVRGYDEQTDSYTNDTEELSGAIADLTKTAKTPGGISLFTDDTKQTYKDTYTLMEEISEIYDDLTDKNRAELLEKLAGKNRGNQIAALIQGFQSGQVQKAYQDTLNSDGSAQQEQDRWLESIEAKQQQFESAFQKMATTTFSSDMFKGLVDGGTNLLNLFTNLTSSIGMLNTAAIGLGIFQGKTGSGKSTWEFAPCIFQMTYAA